MAMETRFVQEKHSWNISIDFIATIVNESVRKYIVGANRQTYWQSIEKFIIMRTNLQLIKFDLVYPELLDIRCMVIHLVDIQWTHC